MKKYIIFFLIVTGLLSINCSEDIPSSPDNYYNGTITFYNMLQYHTIYLTEIVQRRGAIWETNEVQYTVPANGRKAIENIIDGGYDFPGGDAVSITFESAARDPYDPDSPYFVRTVVLTVNGTQNVQVKGQEGEYDIFGDN